MGVGGEGRHRVVPLPLCCAASEPFYLPSSLLFPVSVFHGCGTHINSLGVLFRGAGAWCILGGCVLVLTLYLGRVFASRGSYLFSGG
jgi:hypothetical protein